MTTLPRSARNAPVGSLLKWLGRNPLFRLHRNPLLIKELRGRMRGWRPFAILSGYVLVMSLFVFVLYLFFATTQDSMSTPFTANQIGQYLFAGLTVIELILATLITPAATASAISGERERQTYEILRTTLVSAPTLVFGKLGVALLYVGTLLIAGIPLQSLAFLLGGVTPSEVVAAILLMGTTTVFFGSAGILFSALTRQTLSATVAAYGFALFSTVGSFLILIPIERLQGIFTYNYSAYDPLIQTFFIYLNWGIWCLNPFLAAYHSQQTLLMYGSRFYYTTYLPNGMILPLFSPWVVYMLLALLFSVFSLGLSIWRVNRAER